MQQRLYILIVVDIKLSIGVSLTGSVECDGDEVLAKDFIKYVGSEGTILIERFVDL